ncbi:hypothetical protein [Paraherbaspirillum soli]|uniref:Uncharacterized protein n=1 Tax=Paraherbaspirillum soli TaxID=631222 RepID=A0ABW0M6Y0_9BURK
MKHIVLILILSALSLTAAAQTASDNQTVEVTGPTLRIDLPSQYHRMQPEEFYDYMRSYDLSNGMTLNLFYRGRQMYAEVEDQGRHEIVSTASNVFVALDKQLKMTINLRGDNDASGELLMVVPAQHLANGGVIGERLMVVALH